MRAVLAAGFVDVGVAAVVLHGDGFFKAVNIEAVDPVAVQVFVDRVGEGGRGGQKFFGAVVGDDVAGGVHVRIADAAQRDVVCERAGGGKDFALFEIAVQVDDVEGGGVRFNGADHTRKIGGQGRVVFEDGGHREIAVDHALHGAAVAEPAADFVVGEGVGRNLAAFFVVDAGFVFRRQGASVCGDERFEGEAEGIELGLPLGETFRRAREIDDVYFHVRIFGEESGAVQEKSNFTRRARGRYGRVYQRPDEMTRCARLFAPLP